MFPKNSHCQLITRDAWRSFHLSGKVATFSLKVNKEEEEEEEEWWEEKDRSSVKDEDMISVSVEHWGMEQWGRPSDLTPNSAVHHTSVTMETLQWGAIGWLKAPCSLSPVWNLCGCGLIRFYWQWTNNQPMTSDSDRNMVQSGLVLRHLASPFFNWAMPTSNQLEEYRKTKKKYEKSLTWRNINCSNFGRKWCVHVGSHHS